MQQVLKIGDTVSFKDASTLKGSASVFDQITKERLGSNYELKIVGYQRFDPTGDLAAESYSIGRVVPEECYVWLTSGLEIPGFTRPRMYSGKTFPCMRFSRSLVESSTFDDGLDNWV